MTDAQIRCLYAIKRTNRPPRNSRSCTALLDKGLIVQKLRADDRPRYAITPTGEEILNQWETQQACQALSARFARILP